MVRMIREGYYWIENSPSVATLRFNYGHSHGQVCLAQAACLVDFVVCDEMLDEIKKMFEKRLDELSKQA